MLRCSYRRELVRSLDCGRAERSLNFSGAERRHGCRGEEKGWAASSVTREEKTEEELNGEDTTPCTIGEERRDEIRRGEEEMRRS
ncbi:hypothetical protein HID58_073956 [Brassica napus]|uniref:Uncharacterized protein n=1 Tax=Brassica napus TaxID=3708 RepID=A0ABQ7YFG2_BRANA|nr:hypothetical protein HID58_073956 [Brassica napus]